MVSKRGSRWWCRGGMNGSLRKVALVYSSLMELEIQSNIPASSLPVRPRLRGPWLAVFCSRRRCR